MLLLRPFRMATGVLISAMLASPGCVARNGVDHNAEFAELSSLAHAVALEPYSPGKDARAHRINAIVEDVVAAGRAEFIPPAVIDDLATMVGDHGTALVACRTLATIGPRARRALPAIEREIEVLEQHDQTSVLASPVPTVALLRHCASQLRG